MLNINFQPGIIIFIDANIEIRYDKYCTKLIKPYVRFRKIVHVNGNYI